MNTGWSGGSYGVGKRMSLKITRGILDAIHSGDLEKSEFVTMPGFNLKVPKAINGIDSNLFMPVNTWTDKKAYNVQAKKLAAQFVKNMEKYHDGTPVEVIQKGGPSKDF